MRRRHESSLLRFNGLERLLTQGDKLISHRLIDHQPVTALGGDRDGT